MRPPLHAGYSPPTKRTCVCSFGFPAHPQADPVLFLRSDTPAPPESPSMRGVVFSAWCSWPGPPGTSGVGRNSVPLFCGCCSGPCMSHLPAHSLPVRPRPSQSLAPELQAARVRFSPEKGPKQGRGCGKQLGCPREVSLGVFPARGRPAQGSKAAQKLPTPWS